MGVHREVVSSRSELIAPPKAAAVRTLRLFRLLPHRMVYSTITGSEQGVGLAGNGQEKDESGASERKSHLRPPARQKPPSRLFLCVTGVPGTIEDLQTRLVVVSSSQGSCIGSKRCRKTGEKLFFAMATKN